MSENPFKAWRVGEGLSQVEAATRVESHALTWMRWENGTHKPRKSQWPKIKEVTGITPLRLEVFLSEIAA